MLLLATIIVSVVRQSENVVPKTGMAGVVPKTGMADVVPKTGRAAIDADLQKACECASMIDIIQNHLEANPDDIYARLDLFNLTNLYDTLIANLLTITPMNDEQSIGT